MEVNKYFVMLPFVYQAKNRFKRISGAAGEGIKMVSSKVSNTVVQEGAHKTEKAFWGQIGGEIPV